MDDKKINIAIDLSPLYDPHHSVRGSGFYLKNLKDSIEKYSKEYSFTFFTQTQKIPNNVSLVHFPYFEPFFLTLKLPSRVKSVVTVHDLTPLIFPNNFPSGIKGHLKWHLQKKRLRKVSHIITDSNSSKNDIASLCSISKDKISVVYLAASEDFKVFKDTSWKKELLKKYSLPDKFLLYVGDATWNKNLPILVSSAIELNLPLVMIGKALSQSNDSKNGWNKDLVYVQSMAKQSNQIRILGFVENEELTKFYNIATALVMPSKYEGFGLPILEAMQSGCPVITTREGSIPEVAGNAAEYADANSKESLKETIKKVYDSHSLQRELSQKGMKQSKQFSWKKTAL